LDDLVVFFFFVAVCVVLVGGVVEAPCGGGGLAPWASTSEVEPISIAPIAIALSIVIDPPPDYFARYPDVLNVPQEWDKLASVR
jgi:hypothetical protein